MALDTFGGGEIENWLDRYSLNPDIEWLLLDLGVEVLDDLDTLFESTNDLLVKAQEALPDTEFRHFVHSYKHFKGKFEEADEKSAPVDTSWSVVDHSTTSSKKVVSVVEGKAKQDDRKVIRKGRRLADLERRLREVETLELAILLDCTGSMGAFIDAAKDNIRALVNEIRAMQASVPLRVAFIGYRDLCDGAHSMIVLPFTKSISQFESQLGAVKALGGGNPLTDLIGALQHAQTLDWSSSNRVLYHIGDYPCHGIEFHHNLHDHYPGGDPSGRHPRAFLQRLSELNVHYHFGKLTDHTDKMVARFNELMGCDYVKTTPMNSKNMMDVISLTVTNVLTTTLSSSSSTDNATAITVRDFEIEPQTPDWRATKVERAVIYQLTPVQSLDALAAGTALKEKTVEDFPEPKHGTYKCAAQPFAKGRSKLAFYAQRIRDDKSSSTATMHAVVLKESLYTNSRYQTKEKFEEMVSCQRAAAYLSQVFNKVKPAGCTKIEFAPVRVLQFLARPGRPYFIEEDQIPGVWERYNNNTGWCAPEPTVNGTHHRSVQAFSHWTHHITGGELMVTDCQGSYDPAHHAFLLTDPAVHSAALLSYGGTNMGDKGFKRFFSTHQCNEVCQAMGLPKYTA